ncbi:MAG: hypothetical protein HYR94_26050 [Chloroflexi bacterium]|nr:hypothetical protein [Chloroflexota bacterium]
MLYQIEIFSQGEFITRQTVEAPDALTAINRVEASYGQPPKMEEITVHLEDGKKEHLLVVSDWHGYSFVARQIKSPLA